MHEPSLRPSPALGHALFDTAVGRCALAWSAAGVRAVQLPEQDDAATVARLLRASGPCHAATPPPDAAAAIQGIQALLQGHKLDLREVVLDMTQVSDFHQRVYAITRAIPPGQVRTYGDIAEQLGSKGLARAVGQALGLNPFAPVVPCHRVLGAGFQAGGFSATGGTATKLRMLQIEGACWGDTQALPGF